MNNLFFLFMNNEKSFINILKVKYNIFILNNFIFINFYSIYFLTC